MLGIDLDANSLIKARKIAERIAADLMGRPMIDRMREAAAIVARDARLNAPVDTGRLRASIMPEVKTEGNTVMGVVGSNVIYAPFVELDTAPHYPPLYPLMLWAKRKFNLTDQEAWASARGIQLKIGARGTQGKKFLQNAFQSNRSRIVEIIGRAVSGIIRDDTK